MQRSKRLFSLLFFVLIPFGGLYLILHYIVHANLVCIILSEIGLIFPMLMISNEIGLRQLYKQSVLLDSEVLESKKIKQSDDDFEVYGDCYRTIVSFAHNGETIEKRLYSEGKIKKQFVRIYYNTKTEETNFESDIKECENTRKSKALWVIGFIFFITAIIVEIWNRIGISVTPEQFSYGFGLIVSLLFVFMGIMMIKSSRDNKDETKNKCISGTLVEYRLVDDIKAENGERDCYPVYQYYYNGEEKLHVANSAHKHQKPIGTKTKLFINQDNEVFELNDIKSGRWIDFAFLVIGLIGTAVCAINLFVGPIFV